MKNQITRRRRLPWIARVLVMAPMVLGTVAAAPEATAAQECAGNACSYVTVDWNGRCYLVTNRHSSRKIRAAVSTGPATFSKVLGPGKSFVPGFGGHQCIKMYQMPYHANFQ